MNTDDEKKSGIKRVKTKMTLLPITVQSLEELLKFIPSNKAGKFESIKGMIVRIDDPVIPLYATYVNVIGTNHSMNDWYRISCINDPIFINIMSNVYNVAPDEFEIELIDGDGSLIDFNKDHQCFIEQHLCKEFGFEVLDFKSFNDLLKFQDDKSDEHDIILFGVIIRVGDLIWINTTGRNRSMDDWYCVKSIVDPKFIEIVRLANGVNHAIHNIRVKLIFKSIR